MVESTVDIINCIFTTNILAPVLKDFDILVGKKSLATSKCEKLIVILVNIHDCHHASMIPRKPAALANGIMAEIATEEETSQRLHRNL